MQDRIVDVLRKPLDVARHATAESLLAERRTAPAELPDDMKQKLNEIRDKLDKFLEQQKKVIEANENLAKKPVEDFTKEERNC